MRRWQQIRKSFYQRHSHEWPYAAVVLRGSYEEAGDRGRFRVRSGDVLIHEHFDSHLNRFSEYGALVLNLRLPTDRLFEAGMAKVPDLDSIARLADKKPVEAADLLVSMIMPSQSAPADWPEALAVELAHDPSISLSGWGERNGLAPWMVSRGFEQVFGVSPSAFRARARTRLAWRAIRASGDPLAEIASRLGFADQAHMTRSVKLVTGRTPREWRVGCK
jgi:AraC-like DNA-binding protein